MSRVPKNTLLYLSRRSYAMAAAAEASRALPEAAASALKAATATAETGGTGKEIFWMRDPKTGNWIPENRFEEIDVAELRAQLLNPKK